MHGYLLLSVLHISRSKQNVFGNILLPKFLELEVLQTLKISLQLKVIKY